MGRAIHQDNRLDDHQKRIEDLEGVVAELSNALMNTKQTKSIDLHDDRFMPPAGKRKKTTKKAKETEKV